MSLSFLLSNLFSIIYYIYVGSKVVRFALHPFRCVNFGGNIMINPFDFSAEEDRKAQEWLRRHENDLDLFDVLSEGIDCLLNFSFEALRDEELSETEEDNNWD